MLHFYIHMHSSLKKSKQNTKEQFELIAKLRGRQISHVYVSPLHFNTHTHTPCVGGAVIAYYFFSLEKNVLGKCWGLTNSLSLIDGHLSLFQ